MAQLINPLAAHIRTVKRRLIVIGGTILGSLILTFSFSAEMIAWLNQNYGHTKDTIKPQVDIYNVDGKDIIIEVPLGTVAFDEETENREGEILEDGQELVWVRGGKGGLGNKNFATATNQAPEYVQPGEPGSEGWKVLELKVLADVGLVGFPNAGKSTLLSSITAAKPKIADYAFTTLTPQLGMVEYRDGRSFCMADLPGIIEGAAEGKGLGHRFLRHIERNPVLLFLIPADSKDHRKELEILMKELEEYNPELLDKKFIIAISKSDMLDDELKEAIAATLPANVPHVFISAMANQGIVQLKDMLWSALNTTSNP